jgi:hypothetical protein
MNSNQIALKLTLNNNSSKCNFCPANNTPNIVNKSLNIVNKSINTNNINKKNKILIFPSLPPRPIEN